MTSVPGPTPAATYAECRVLVPLQQLAGKFLMTMKEYPPSQSAGSFNLDFGGSCDA